MGGRLLQIRSIARADKDLLPEEAIDFETKAPESVKELRKAATAALPANVEKIAESAASLEARANSIALSRIRIPRTLPPRLVDKTDAKRIPKNKALLTFVSVGKKVYGAIASDGKVTVWPIKAGARIPSQVRDLLRSIGVGQATKRRLPEDDQWRSEAVDLRRLILPDDQTLSPELYDEIVIVPDGVLWYVPFEILPIGDPSTPLLGDKIKITYAATPGLALHPTGPVANNRKIGIAVGTFFDRDFEINQMKAKALIEAVPDPVKLPEEINGPSNMLVDSVGHLVVAAPMAPNIKCPWDRR